MSFLFTVDLSFDFFSPYPPPPRQGNLDAHCNSISMFVQYTFVQNSCSAINQRSTFHRYGCFFSTMRRKMCPRYPMCNSFFARFGFGQQVLFTYRWIFPRVCYMSAVEKEIDDNAEFNFRKFAPTENNYLMNHNCLHQRVIFTGS